MQSADAGHVSKTEIPVATLPELGELGEVSPVEKLSLTPATLKEVTLDFLPLEGGKICTSVASPPCGGAIERGNPASEVRETVGALTIIPERMPKQPCHPKPPPPPPPTGCDPDDSAPLPPPAIW
ncbi:MAG: hypothetical protein NTY30_04860 [Candidatus Berkelbacteria bacterium]|nr:hypothetical protein [Candidatus Berkelbacteria bacterium]